jgi:transposase
VNVQVSNAISDITGVAGQAIIPVILRGERDAHRLAQLRDRRLQAAPEGTVRSLEGNWREDMLFELDLAFALAEWASPRRTGA